MLAPLRAVALVLGFGSAFAAGPFQVPAPASVVKPAKKPKTPPIDKIKSDSYAATLSAEMNQDAEVGYCYDKSESGVRKKKARVILNFKVNAQKKPTEVVAINNPRSSKDKTLTECLEGVLRNYIYPLPRGRSELQLDLKFPVKK